MSADKKPNPNLNADKTRKLLLNKTLLHFDTIRCLIFWGRFSEIRGTTIDKAGNTVGRKKGTFKLFVAR